MNDAKKFFTYLKIIYLIASILLIIIFTAVLITNLYTCNWKMFFLFIFSISFIALPIATFIYVYYLNMVIEVKFHNKTVEIFTNKKCYYYDTNQILKIMKGVGKIYIYCEDKKFVCQTVYFFKEKLPNINEWKNKLTCTEFIGFK